MKNNKFNKIHLFMLKQREVFYVFFGFHRKNYISGTFKRYYNEEQQHVMN